jgi:glycolate oxidase FAD binding subunit
VKTAGDRALPASAEALAEIVASCDRSGEKIHIVGGNTLAGMGFPPERADVVVGTTAMKGIVANERADLVFAARAGTSIQDIAALLAAQGQFIPFDAPVRRYATLGGTLAAGWLGPRRHCYGRLRDYVLGSVIVLPDGTIARAGGMVVKNVAGYDMSRLYVGSFGTLGVLVQANLKTLPMPAHARLFLASLPEGTRERACGQLAALRVPPAAAFWVVGFRRSIAGDDGDEGRVLALFEGSDALLERATREVRSALGRAGVPETSVIDAGAREAFERIVDAYVACLGERSVTYRICGSAGNAAQRALRLQALADGFKLRSEAIADVMNGDVVLRVRARDVQTLGGIVERFDDALHGAEPWAQVIASNHPHRQYLRVWGTAPPAVERMRALKERFDPKRTLNPGRFVGGI